ncbi:MAG TPA: ester cyclase [Dehalococcoidia bacterium]|nr:ester cyclase [Dehalococcoidia bacterium]
MSGQGSKALIERYIQALNGSAKSPQLVDEYVDDGSLREHIALFEQAFPGYTIEVHDLLADDDRVALRGTFRGVQRGEFQGIAPTGRTVSVSLILIYRIAGGKIVEHWMNADVLGLLQQLGATPVPA